MGRNLKSTNGVITFLPLIIVSVLIALVVGYVAFTLNSVGKQCGGFAANLPEFQCPLGLLCKTKSSYPDAGGTCQHIWPLSLITSKVSSGTDSNNNEQGSESDSQFCGGIANVSCPEGYRCKLDRNYPDAGGKCVRF